VLGRPRLARSQFVFTEVKGRPAVFWQTQKTAKPRTPEGGSPVGGPWPRASRSCSTPESATRFASGAGTSPPNERPSRLGTTGVRADEGHLVAAVERKSLENLAASLSDGTLAFQVQCLAELPTLVPSVVACTQHGPAIRSTTRMPRPAGGGLDRRSIGFPGPTAGPGPRPRRRR
jgi:hypothetical protein